MNEEEQIEYNDIQEEEQIEYKFKDSEKEDNPLLITLIYFNSCGYAC